MVRYVQRVKQLISFQLGDEEVMKAARGTLRVRFECEGGDLNRIKKADMCFKGDKELDGSLYRPEYEVAYPIDLLRQRIFILDPLRAKYGRNRFPDLNDSLDIVEGAGPLEVQLRIDCLRKRFVLEFSSKKFKGLRKNAFSEMLHDSVAYALDDLPNYDSTVIIGWDRENENEALIKKPCAYDPNPKKDLFVSQGLSRKEIGYLTAAFRKELDIAAPGMFTPNEESKAERGYRRRREFFKAILQKLGGSEAVKEAFQAAGATQNVRILSPSNQPVFPCHEIATSRPGQKPLILLAA